MLLFKVAFSLFSNINQLPCSTLDWVLNSQSELTECCTSIIGNFQYKRRLIPMLTCPIAFCSGGCPYYILLPLPAKCLSEFNVVAYAFTSTIIVKIYNIVMYDRALKVMKFLANGCLESQTFKLCMDIVSCITLSIK